MLTNLKQLTKIQLKQRYQQINSNPNTNAEKRQVKTSANSRYQAMICSF
jgi:hypothetical protein